jgi:uncharacterized phage protein gp47/JayE
MTEEDYFKQFDPNTATGQYLENFSALVTVYREQYGDDPDNKPNDHCVWRDVGYMHEMWRWVENDEHLRSRLKERVK